MRRFKSFTFRRRKSTKRNQYSHSYWDNLYEDILNDKNLKYRKGSIYQSYKWK